MRPAKKPHRQTTETNFYLEGEGQRMLSGKALAKLAKGPGLKPQHHSAKHNTDL